MNVSAFFDRNDDVDNLRPPHDRPDGDTSGRTGNFMGCMTDNAIPLGERMPSEQSLDEIVRQNATVMRRRSTPMDYDATPGGLAADLRRISMMEFSGQSDGGPLDSFLFDPAVVSNMDSIMTPVERTGAVADADSGNQTPNSMNLSVGSQIRGHDPSFTPLLASDSSYAHAGGVRGTQEIDSNSVFDPSMPASMDYSDQPVTSMVNTDVALFSDNQLTSPMTGSPMHDGFTTRFPPVGSRPSQLRHETSASIHPSVDRRGDHMVLSQRSMNRPIFGVGTPPGTRRTSRPSMALSSTGTVDTSSTDTSNQVRSNRSARTAQSDRFSSASRQTPAVESPFKNAYSSSGFDMLGVLTRVATRPNPEINIGSVDLSCAFVVCDATLEDDPIVYCSENFERLTGYTKDMIIGRNCRFLQSPDGKVEAGVKRRYVDDDAVFYLKTMLDMRHESQISLINYRRGGQPFMNLLTMIPITWDTPDVKFFVGFQVDLVETPHSVTSKNPDGSYTINYQRGVAMPSYTLQSYVAPQQLEFGQTIPRDDVSTALRALGTGEAELPKKIWDKVLLENTDDVVHVLSLKGLFLYLSPACQKILEYEPKELVGTALSSVCHPSDIVPVTRDLKDTASGAAINVVFRIRRKNKGYMWFESHGALHMEQGKGRKCIILVGRERPVYSASKREILESGGIGENELWCKMSTAGMFLFVASNVRQLLDRQPEDLIGSSIQALMRPDSRVEFGRVLENARAGKRGSLKHEMMNRRGQVLQAYSTVYPGDAAEGQKPTFVVVQTRFFKFSRGGSHSLPPGLAKGASGPSHGPGSTSDLPVATPPSTALTASSDGSPMGRVLAIGRQDEKLASAENLFDELKTTRSSSWQYELRQMERQNRMLAEEVQGLQAAKKKRKRRKGAGHLQKDCANCHTKVTPEWRRGPSGNRDLCNSCGLRWAKQNGRVSPRAPSHRSQSISDGRGSRDSKTPQSPLATNPSDASRRAVDGAATRPPGTGAVGHGTPGIAIGESQGDTSGAIGALARMDVRSLRREALGSGVPAQIDEAVELD